MCMCTCVHVHVCDDVMHTADLLLQVFTSSDIEQFLSSHTFIFTGVDKEWQELMILTAKNPSIMQVCLRSGRYGQHFNHQIYFILKKLKCHPLQKEQYPNTVLISVDLLCSLKLFLPLPPPWLIHNCVCMCVCAFLLSRPPSSAGEDAGRAPEVPEGSATAHGQPEVAVPVVFIPTS